MKVGIIYQFVMQFGNIPEIFDTLIELTMFSEFEKFISNFFSRVSK